jgi:hypothetical protein
VAGTVYGCDIGSVREIVPIRHATRLPGAPPYVRGLINLRGAIVTVIDLAARLAGTSAAMEGSVVLATTAANTSGWPSTRCETFSCSRRTVSSRRLVTSRAAGSCAVWDIWTTESS